MNIILSKSANSYWIDNQEYYSIKSFDKFKKYFFPDIDNDKHNDSNTIFFIHHICEENLDENKNIKNLIINIMLSVENCYEHKHYHHYNKYGNYGNGNIKIYLYNHIDKYIETDFYIVVPIIYIQISYFLKNFQIIKPISNIEFSKKKFCIIASTNSYRDKKKQDVINILKKIGTCDKINIYKPIIGNKSCYHSQELLNLFNNYKFVFVCENSLTNGYITEKIFNCFFARSIPIYSGPDDVNRYFNKDSFINANNEENIEREVKELLNNEELFNQKILSNKINKTYDNENYSLRMQEFINKIIKQ
jgi:hypothetical protein